MRKYTGYILISFLILACSGSKDTSNMTPEEHFNYAMELYNDEDYDEVVNEFQTILLQYPGSTINDDAQYYLGMTYFKREQFLLSAYEFSKLIRDIPASTFVPDAQFMLSDSYYNLSPPYQLDQAYTKKAIEEFQAFIDFFPMNPKVEEAENKIHELNERLAEKEYKSGLIYERMDLFNAAIDYYKNVVETYHDTKFAPLSLYNKIQIEIKRNKISDALKDISYFLLRYPDDPFAEELREIQENLLTEG
ncbi:outer membrane protein assembly factor BamD [Bacteroidota bacterium]